MIEKKMISENNESLFLSKVSEDHMAGEIVINGDQCVNGSSACQGSLNNSRCSNGNCDNSSNGRKCTVLSPSIGIF